MVIGIEAINQQIEEHTASAINELQSLASCSLADGRNRTPFDVAIISDNRLVIDYLSSRKACLNAFVELDKTQKKNIKRALSYASSTDSLRQAEAFIVQNFGENTPLERTPLLQACRFDNRYAIEKIVSKKVSASVRDVAGFSALDICHEVGGEVLLRFFVATCREAGVQIMLSEHLISKYVHDSGMLALLRDACKASVNNHRLLLAAYCSLLDVENVKCLLEKGIDVNKCISPEHHPLFEACTSYLMWEWQHPQFSELAYAYTQANGHPAAQSLHIDNSLIAGADSLDDIERLFAGAQSQQEALQEGVETSLLSSAQLNAQLRKRLAIIDLLLDAGLDAQAAEKKSPDLFVSRLVGLKQPAILQKLAAHGFALKPAEYEDGFLDDEGLAYLQQWVARASDDPLGVGTG